MSDPLKLARHALREAGGDPDAAVARLAAVLEWGIPPDDAWRLARRMVQKALEETRNGGEQA